MAAIPRLDVLKAISTETIEKQIVKTHLWYNFKIVKHSEGMPFDCIEMILTIFMKFLPHHTGLFLSSTLCIAPLAPREHFQNHRIFFHRQE